MTESQKDFYGKDDAIMDLKKFGIYDSELQKYFDKLSDIATEVCVRGIGVLAWCCYVLQEHAPIEILLKRYNFSPQEIDDAMMAIENYDDPYEENSLILEALLKTGKTSKEARTEKFLYCVACGNKYTVKLLIDHGVDIHANNDQALLDSFTAKRYSTVSLLLENGCNANVIPDACLRDNINYSYRMNDMIVQARTNKQHPYYSLYQDNSKL